jgi:HTH-type transcriptional regulator/antitoxin HigA
MIKEKKDISKMLRVWPSVSKVVSTINNDRQYNRAVKLLDSLIDEVTQKPDSVKESLIDTLGTLIKEYEDRNIPEPQANGIDALKYLMEEHNLKQNDLSEIGSQGVVSEILNGKRELNLRQVKLLSQRFSVSPNVFID